MDDKLRLVGAQAWALLGIVGVAAVALFVIWRVRVIFPPLLIAATIVFLLNPVVHRLAQRGMPRAAAAGLTYLAVIVGAGLLVLALSPLVGGQVDQ
jgi:putative heme transporter